ncbi:MAG: M23 family metallopeptidase [Bacillota bacterium]|nr:M23 family metallopeptidase [Bacillota bacterium]
MRSDNKKSSKPAAALVLCFCLMALISILAVQASIDKVKDSMRTADVVKKKAVDDDKTKTAPDVVDSENNAPESSGPDAEAISDYIFPVEGEIIMEYSSDIPVYWKTLDQYMTHPGIDIAADAGTPVQAAANGTVTKIEKDCPMGITVEINHGDGVITIYSNLAADGLIELGEIVTSGTVIGKIGQTSMFEFDSPDHLHFEMIKDDEHVDPMEYLTPLS